MLNLGNPEDARMIGRAADRQRMADGLVLALFDYFGEDPPETMARLEPAP